VPTRDAVFLFWDDNPDTGGDDVWLNEQITNVSDAVCANGDAGYELRLSPGIASLSTKVGVGVPVRTYEVMQMGLYLSGGEYWLGARSVSVEATMQPVLGPLTSDGVAFNFLDGTGLPTTDAGLVKSIQVTLKGLTDQPIVVGGNSKTAYVRDSLTAQVVLRNALR